MKSAAAALAALAVLLPGEAPAQTTAADTAGVLQTWRQGCADPNPDMVIGALLKAVETGNVLVRQVCLREALASDNTDVRRTALRMIIGAAPLVRFRVTEPTEYRSERGDQELWLLIQAGLAFVAKDGNPETGTATWFPIVENSLPSEQSSGSASVLGAGLFWSGPVLLFSSLNNCKLSADLTVGDQLVGTFVCSGGSVFPVTASLLD